MAKTLGEVFEGLSFGLLAGISLGNEASGEIDVANSNRVVGLVNKSLQRLYGEFSLSVKEFDLRTIEGKTLYALRSKHADTDPALETKWIADTPANPYRSDIIRILSIFDEDNNQLLLNDESDEKSIYTPAYDLLQVPEGLKDGYTYSCVYQARHGRLGFGDLTQLIYLPEPLFEALDEHVAYQVFNAMNGQEHRSKAADHMASYMRVIQKAKDDNITNTSYVNAGTKLDDRGFV